jgi:hypothetical protein
MLAEKHAIEGENLTLDCVENNQRGLEKKLNENHVIEGKNLPLECAENNQGGLGEVSPDNRRGRNSRGSILNRELRRIS